MKNKNLASMLTERVTIERPELIADGSGGFNTNWVEVTTIWAGIAAFTRSYAHERVVDEQLTQQQRLRMTIRYRTDIDYTMRARVHGSYWNIRTVVDPDFSNTRLECVLEQGVAL